MASGEIETTTEVPSRQYDDIRDFRDQEGNSQCSRKEVQLLKPLT